MFRQQRQLPNSIGVSKCFYFIKVIKSLEKEIEPTQRKVIFEDFFFATRLKGKSNFQL
jgi:hypothetical protein